MNVSKNTINALNSIITECFQCNRWLDRFVSVLGVKFACNNMSDLIHIGISHWFPKLSDSLGEKCLERYNIVVDYGATDSGLQDYETVTEMMKKLEEYIIDFQNMYMGVCKVAFENNDLHVYSDLLDMLEDVNKVVEQVILLNDKMGIYTEEKISSMDAHVKEHFWILD